MTSALLLLLAQHPEAAESGGETVAHWAINLVMLALVATAGFLIKHAFTQFTASLEALGKKIDALTSTQGDHGTSVRLLEQLAQRTEHEVDKLRTRVHELSQTVAVLAAKVHGRSSSGLHPAVRTGGDDE